MARPHRTLRVLLPGLFLASFLLASAPFQSLGATATAPGPAPDPDSPFGVAGVMRWPDWGSFSRPADAMMQTGGSWVREDFAWGLIEPHPGQFDWTATDRIMGTLTAHKLNILGIIAYSANWATPSTDDDKNPSAVSMYPPDLGKYYTFVRTLAAHYKGLVHYWEVWNEPNNGQFWKPSPNPQQYADVLKTAYRAIKDADPTAKVLNGGVSGNAVPYLEAMLSAGAGNSFDILALHPYAVPSDPNQGRVESRPEVHKLVDVELTKYQAFLERHGYSRPIWVTEIGWPANNWQLSEQDQADYLAQAYAQLLSSGLVQRVFWYDFKDSTNQPGDSWGLTAWGAGSTDLGPRRPSFAAYSTSARLLSGTTPAGRLQLAPFNVVADFEQPATWNRSVSNSGSFTVSTEQHHEGSASGKLSYSFDGPNQAVDFSPPQPIALPGNPTRVGLWVRGDASGDYLSAWLRDRDGELFKMRLGAAMGSSKGWRYYESRVNNYYFDWERAGGNPANGKVDYPVSFVGFRLENTPDEPAGSGTIYVDDLQSFDGPDVSAVRFDTNDGTVVDVLWSVDAVQVNLPTNSASAQATNRDGATQTVNASGASLPLRVTSSPIYVVHKPALTGMSEQIAGAGTQPGPTSMCGAAQRVDPANNSAGQYFQETGHNLSGAFLQYWQQHNGLNTFGFPITEQFIAPSTDGKSYIQQYFERARMEYHPENQPPYDVQLGLLGVWVSSEKHFARDPQPSPGANLMYFAETGHALVQFKAWWSAHGGLPEFGFPISGELQEKNAADGKTYTVQYFERNRLEYHPELAGTDREVMLGLLGVEYLAQQGCK